MSAEPLEGFWTSPKTMPGTLHHFFVAGDEKSVCGRWRLREMGEDREDRKPGHTDCNKCTDIHAELFKAQVPAAVEDSPAWTVKTDYEDGDVHLLLFHGKEQSRGRGAAFLSTQHDLAALLNKNGTVPKKAGRAKCAADAKDPARFLEQKSSQSPELPLSTESETPTPQIMSKNTAAVEPTPRSTPADSATNRHAEYYRADDFIRYPENRVIQPDQAAKMKDSLLEVGMLQPITARRWTDPETSKVHLQIIIGECRWRGALLIGADYMVPAFVREISDKEAAKINAIENFQRQELDAVQEAHSIQNMKSQGWNHDEIENFLGVKKDYIYQRLTLLKLDEAAHVAIREGNLSLKTAEYLAAIPEEKRAAALEAVVTPKYSTGALPQRDAIKLLEREYIEPMKQAEEWAAKENAVMENHPGAKWNDYEAARAIAKNSNKYERADNKPWKNMLSDSARAEELVLPTWGELAKKHGATLHIACDYDGEAICVVESAPVIEAEKAACNENPALCIFVHEEAVQKSKEDGERRKEELAAHKRALSEERAKAAALVLSPDGLNKTTIKKLVECYAIATDGIETAPEHDELMAIFGIEKKEGEDYSEDTLPRLNAAMEKYLRSKALSPFEALGRIAIAAWVHPSSGWCGIAVSDGFETGIFKRADYPALAKEYDEVLKERARQQSLQKEREAQEAASAAAVCETENDEEAA